MHNAFLQLPGDEKMSKSVGNIFTIADLAQRGIHPLSFRYFTFQAHYRTPLNFTWEALEAAQTALYRIYEAAAELAQSAEPASSPSDEAEAVRGSFHDAVNRDLDMPGAVATVHGLLAGALPAAEKLALLADFDRVLALDILPIATSLRELREGERVLLDRRAEARASKDWATSDQIRGELATGGLEVKDTPQGQRWLRRDVLPRSGGQES
jgi:cysteinyl-tRNA synthetase